jgi:DNA-binding GntR family transcriptional regulator
MKRLAEHVQLGESATRIYDGLRARILSMTLAPGSSIDEAALVAEFQVSRTPIREAIVRLAAEGLLVLLPNRGSQVAPLDLARIRDYLEAMDLIQCAVTALAARRRTPAELKTIYALRDAFEAAVRSNETESLVERNRDFHAAIGVACKNELLIGPYTRLLDEGLRISRFTLNNQSYSSRDDFESFVTTVMTEHTEMAAAIEAQDMARAESLARAHTDLTRLRFKTFLSEGLSPTRSVFSSEG